MKTAKHHHLNSSNNTTVPASPPLFPFTRPIEERDCLSSTATPTSGPCELTPPTRKNRESLLVQVGVDDDEDDDQFRKTASHLLHRSSQQQKRTEAPSSPTTESTSASSTSHPQGDEDVSISETVENLHVEQMKKADCEIKPKQNSVRIHSATFPTRGITEEAEEDCRHLPEPNPLGCWEEKQSEAHDAAPLSFGAPETQFDTEPTWQDFSMDQQSFPNIATQDDYTDDDCTNESSEFYPARGGGEFLDEHKDSLDQDPETSLASASAADDQVHLLILTSSFGYSHQVPQQRCIMILEKSGYVYETLDGALHKELRNFLWGVSGLSGVYPQCFVVRGENVYFVGDIDAMDRINDASQMDAEILESNPSILTWDRLMAFDPGAEGDDES